MRGRRRGRSCSAERARTGQGMASLNDVEWVSSNPKDACLLLQVEYCLSVHPNGGLAVAIRLRRCHQSPPSLGRHPHSHRPSHRPLMLVIYIWDISVILATCSRSRRLFSRTQVDPTGASQAFNSGVSKNLSLPTVVAMRTDVQQHQKVLFSGQKPSPGRQPDGQTQRENQRQPGAISKRWACCCCCCALEFGPQVYVRL